MAQHVQALPRCSICAELMIARERGDAQRHLPAEFVCRNFDCLDFGIYKRAPIRVDGRGPSAVPGAFLG